MNKYHNVKTKGFDSRKEYNRYLELKQMEKDGKIFGFLKQVSFELIPKQNGERAVNYIADFTYLKNNEVGVAEHIVEDVKSEMTRKLPTYIIKRKLMLFIHGIKITEI